MKRRASILIFLSLTLAATDWATASVVVDFSGLAAEASTNNCVPVGRLISVQGQVQLKRKRWSDYHPTAVGAVLCLGDLLQPVRGATAIVQCVDPTQTLWTLPKGVPSGAAIGCHPLETPIHTITGPITPTRDQVARRIPYIISPKNTWLLNALPKLRWMAVPGATSYTVRVSGSGVNWETEVSTTSVIYPGKPPLKPVEEGYLLKVEADNGESPAEATFGLLDRNKATRLRTAAKQLARQDLTDDAKTLALADLYIGQGLIAEATELLEASVASGSKTAAVYHTLGDLYAQVELLSQASVNYFKAVELATTAKDMEGQAAAEARLGQVYNAMGNSAQAIHWSQKAQKEYQALGELDFNP